MKAKMLTVALLFVCCILKGQITFHAIYGGMGQDHAQCVRQTTDAGYIIIGDTPGIINEAGAYLIKTDEQGDTLWTKILGNCRGESVKQTTDGGYIIGGSSPDAWNPPANSDLVLIKTDANGNLVWNKQFSRYSNDYGTSVLQTNDGGYVVSGYIIEPTMSITICLIKTDSNGNILWSKFLYGAPFDNLNSLCYLNLDDNLQQTNDGGYIITGSCVTGGSNIDVFLIKLNDIGNFIWMKTYENVVALSNNYGNSVQQTNDNGYMVIGNVNNTNAATLDPYLLKTDSSGNLQWNKTYIGTYLSNSRTAMQTSDNGYIIGINSLDSISFTYDVCLIKTDNAGNISWSKIYGDILNDDYAASVRQTFDNGYVVAGSRYDPIHDFEFYLIKTDSTGSSGCNENNFTPVVNIPSIIVTSYILFDSSGIGVTSPSIITEQGGSAITLCNSTGISETEKHNLFIIFPNPSSTEFQISYFNFQKDDQLIFADALGKISFTKKIESPTSNLKLQTSNFSNGIYFLEIKTKEGVLNKKVVVQH